MFCHMVLNPSCPRHADDFYAIYANLFSCEILNFDVRLNVWSSLAGIFKRIFILNCLNCCVGRKCSSDDLCLRDNGKHYGIRVAPYLAHRSCPWLSSLQSASISCLVIARCRSATLLTVLYVRLSSSLIASQSAVIQNMFSASVDCIKVTYSINSVNFYLEMCASQ